VKCSPSRKKNISTKIQDERKGAGLEMHAQRKSAGPLSIFPKKRNPRPPRLEGGSPPSILVLAIEDLPAPREFRFPPLRGGTLELLQWWSGLEPSGTVWNWNRSSCNSLK
jgi:hypothetical protein